MDCFLEILKTFGVTTSPYKKTKKTLDSFLEGKKLFSYDPLKFVQCVHWANAIVNIWLPNGVVLKS